MKKQSLKVFSILIILIVVLQTTSVFAATNTVLNSQKSENDKKITEKQSNLEDVKEEKSETQQQVNDLSTKISEYQSQIDELDSKIGDLNSKIEEAQNHLQQKQEDYEKNKKLAEERLVVMQEEGDTSYLDFILKSSSLTDMISNFYLSSEVANADIELINKIDNEKKEVEKAKTELEDSKRDLDTSKAEKQGVSTQLQAAKNEKSAQVAKLSDDQKQIEEELDELQEANKQIQKEINANVAKYQAQIAALNKKNNSSSKNNSSNNSGNSGNYNGGGSGVLARPVASGSITAGMYYPSGSYHGAIDYGVSAGTPVYAAADGVVIKTANLTTSYGTYVVIQHANGLQTWYAHGTSGSICVSEGQTVSRGQQIMKSGNSGHSTGAHLHFEVRVAPYNYNTCRVNPTNYM
jgi:murein DD-endopeptidase MepM/ murein hydrolase activator NlpD